MSAISRSSPSRLRAEMGTTAAKLCSALSLVISGSNFSRSTRSILLMTRKTGQSSLRISCSAKMSSLDERSRLVLSLTASPGSRNSRVASSISNTISRCSSASCTSCIMRRSNCVLGLWTPGVSTKTICAAGYLPFLAGTSTTPWMRVRVVCGFAVTMATFSPVSAFNSVLLPAFGRPIMETNPDRTGTILSYVLSRRHFNSRDTQAFDSPIRRCQYLQSRLAGQHHFTRHGNSPGNLAHQSCNCRRGVMIVSQRFIAGQSFQSIQLQIARNDPHSVALLLRLVGFAVVLVFIRDGANNLFEQVLNRHQPRDATIFINHDAHVLLLALHLAQQLVHAFGLRHKRCGPLQACNSARRRILVGNLQ